MNIRKFFLYLLIGSVSISAAIGMIVILIGNFGELETKVLLTALAVVITSILGLACGALLETGRGKWLPRIGIVLSVASFVMWLVLIWSPGLEGDRFVKSLLTVTLLAAASSLLSLLSLAHLRAALIWSRYAAFGAVGALTAVLVLFIWTEFDYLTESAMQRTIGVLSIAVAALTVVTPVFHKLSQTPSADAGIDEEIARLKKRLGELEEKKAAIDRSAGANDRNIEVPAE